MPRGLEPLAFGSVAERLTVRIPLHEGVAWIRVASWGRRWGPLPRHVSPSSVPL